MADKTATLKVKLKDLATKGIGKLKKAMGGLKTAVGAAGVAMAAIGAVLIKSLAAWGKQQEAVAKLDTALKNVPGATKDTSKELQNLAAELQKTTKFGDEATISMQATLATFGLQADEIKKLTPAILDMAEATGQDLNRAAMLVAKTITTETSSALATYAGEIDEAKFKADPFAATLDKLNQSFEGQAKAAGDTAAGGMVKFQNSVGDLQETIGKIVEGPMNDIIERLLTMMDTLQQNEDAIRTTAQVFVFLGETIFNVFEAVGEIIGTFMFSFMGMVEAILLAVEGDFSGAFEKMKEVSSVTLDSLGSDFDDIVTKQKNAFKKIGKANKLAIKDDAKNKKALLDNTKKDNKLKLEEQKKQDAAELKLTQVKNEKNKKEIEKVISEGMRNRKRIKDAEDKSVAEEKARKDKRFSDAQGFLNTISTLQTSKNKELFAIGKAAAIGSATMDTFKGVAQAWSFGPILGPIFAALVLTAGMAQVSKIAATSMAEGGIVSARAGGTLVRVGEAGQSEAIVPLDDEGGGLGGTNITIEIGTFVGNDEGLEDLAVMLDDKFYDMQRNNESITF